MKHGLLSKMLLSVLTPAIVGLLLIAGVGYKMSEEALRDQLRHDIPTLLESQSVGVDGVFTNVEEALSMLAEVQRISRYLDAYNDGLSELTLERLAREADGTLNYFTRINSNISFAGLAGADGKVIAHHVAGADGPSKSVGTNFSGREYFRRAMAGERCIVGLVSATTGKVTSVVAMPLIRNGKTQGVLFTGVDNEHIASSVTNKVSLGTKGGSYAYDGQGRVVLHYDAAAMGREDGDVPVVKDFLAKREGRFAYRTSQGDARIVYVRDMPKQGWLLCLEFDEAEIFSPIHSMLQNTVLLTVVCVVVVGLIIFFAARGIVRTLAGLSGMAEAVAGGRLELEERERALLDGARNRKDEFSVLAVGMEHMVGSIKRLLGESEQKTADAVQATDEAKAAMAKAEEAALRAESAKREGMLAAAGQLEDVVAIISSASSELSAQIEQSDQIASESARHLAEAATAMNEMNVTVQEVARNAAEASTVSDETRQNAEGGAHIVQSALQSIGRVQDVSVELKEDMTQLNEHAQAITRIMNVISDIADQTNLLALNAAIEAARAGDAGRGFAVVADEVRKLAEKTMESTKDVGSAITAIQSSTAQSVAAMDTALAEVETASRFANESGEALQQIVSNVEASADQVRTIAAASEEQSAASEQINQSIVQVSDMSEQTAQAMSESARAVSDLALQAQRLSKLIEEMKKG